MTANPMDALHPAHSYPPPLVCVPTPEQLNRTYPLIFRRTRTGWIAYRQRQPLAWIVQGHHCGRLNRQPKTCHFVDVAYFRQTDYGINLETADFATLAQALQFVRQTFGGAA